jgi:transketolase
MANAIRVLSMDAVQKANSGHPGAPMGMADIAQVLWSDFLQHNPNNPDFLTVTALSYQTAMGQC